MTHDTGYDQVNCIVENFQPILEEPMQNFADTMAAGREALTNLTTTSSKLASQVQQLPTSNSQMQAHLATIHQQMACMTINNNNNTGGQQCNNKNNCKMNNNHQNNSNNTNWQNNQNHTNLPLYNNNNTYPMIMPQVYPPATPMVIPPANG
eukprot:11266277-Ditylum_brightwellii.AAC.1